MCVTRFITPLRNSLGLVAMAGVCRSLIFCCAACCLCRCPGSRVMSDYGVPDSFSGGVSTLRSLAENGRTVMDTGFLWICHVLARLTSGRWLQEFQVRIIF